MKRTIKTVVSCLVIAAMTASMLWVLTKLTERKGSYSRLSPFYEQEADFDVLWMGSSHPLTGVFPMELWQDYGMVSYNLGGYANSLPTTYWMLQVALEHTSPRLVVIDCLRLSVESTVYTSPEVVHRLFDSIPFSLTKIRAVWDLFPSIKTQLGFLWNFSLYHDRWQELGFEDFVPPVLLEKGAKTEFAVAVPKQTKPIDPSDMLEGETTGVRYLRKMIEDCQARGIQVLLTYMPFPADTLYQREANRVTELAEEYGVAYLNFLTMDIVDYDTDCYDADSHLNSSGAQKVTAYLGRYITENYDIPDRRDDPAYADWYEDYEAYTGFKLENLASQKDLKIHLMLLADEHLSYCLYRTDNALWQENSIYDKLLANAGVDTGALSGGMLAVVDNGNGAVTYLAEGESVDASFGAVSFVRGEDGLHVLIDGEEALAPGTADIETVAVSSVGGQRASARFSLASAVNKK